MINKSTIKTTSNLMPTIFFLTSTMLVFTNNSLANTPGIPEEKSIYPCASFLDLNSMDLVGAQSGEDLAVGFSVRFNQKVPESFYEMAKNYLRLIHATSESSIKKFRKVFIAIADNQFLVISQINEQNGVGYSVNIVQSEANKKIKLRSVDHLFVGGIGARYAFTEKVIKSAVEKVPAATSNVPNWLLLISEKTKQPIFVSFQDENEIDGKTKQPTHTVVRKITDVHYARKYIASRSVIEKIHTKHQVTALELDEVFEEWDGLVFNDVTYAQLHLYWARNLPAGIQFFWFLHKTKDGKLLRVVVLRLPNEKLPTLVTAYSPRPDVSSSLIQFAEQNAPLPF